LVASYLIVWVGIVAWKFIEAGHVLKEEDRIKEPRRKYFEERIAMFSEAQKDALAKIVITGRGRVGSNIYNDLDTAGFIDRDAVGFYRPNEIFLPELQRWLKNRPIPRD
jgi:hypothetical protein